MIASKLTAGLDGAISGERTRGSEGVCLVLEDVVVEGCNLEEMFPESFRWDH